MAAAIITKVVLSFLQLSMVLRSVHSVLVEEYGLPTWGSYLVFALATILVGALLGLVCIFWIGLSKDISGMEIDNQKKFV